jgi:signal transduction histidine kinase
MNDQLSNSNKKEFLEIIFKETNRLENLIEDILSISKIEAGQAFYNFEDISIALIIEHVYNIFKMQATKKDILLTCDIAADLPQIYADQDAIHQVAVNLIGNALKFTPQGGEIKIKLRKENKYLVFSVEDNGLGIPANDQKNIFRKFYRVRRPGTEIPGTGLGLSIVKEIVSVHKGEIKLESEEAKGSRFTVYFPI